jgi:hydroxypyruvate isomerase
LWQELPFVQRVRAAAEAGFEAVECHWPYDEDVSAVRQVLADTRLAMVSVNTPVGDPSRGEFGLAALPGREADARSAVDRAVEFATAVGALNVHVMAGIAEDGGAARDTFIANLDYAAGIAARSGVGVLIEPINRRDRPGYFLERVDRAREYLEAVSSPGVKLMFDCYHVQTTEGGLSRRLRQHLDVIGHVQIAAVPDRGEPDRGEIDYRWLLAELDAMGYRGMVGAEYVPRDSTQSGLSWLEAYRNRKTADAGT